MRIRKRFPPPSAPSDLYLSHSAAAQPKSQAELTSDPPRNPFDEVLAIKDCNTSWAPPEYVDDGEKMKLKESGEDETLTEDQKKKRAINDIRRENNIPYEEECINNTFKLSSSSSGPAKGDTKVLVPLKKRRGSFERIPKEETQISARMKSKTNKKCDLSTQREQESAQKTKKSRRGNIIMEGSRCSRVNGRGWRCCQPTLVGYALCEHHLGKGRVRSMSSVRQNREGNASGGAPPLIGGDTGPQRPMKVTKRRTKVAVVKARSISSLLSQV